MNAARWLRKLAALPLILAVLVLAAARFVITLLFAFTGTATGWVLHGEWWWPGWRSLWRLP